VREDEYMRENGPGNWDALKRLRFAESCMKGEIVAVEARARLNLRSREIHKHHVVAALKQKDHVPVFRRNGQQYASAQCCGGRIGQTSFNIFHHKFDEFAAEQIVIHPSLT